jgi:hypothetical protein
VKREEEIEDWELSRSFWGSAALNSQSLWQRVAQQKRRSGNRPFCDRYHSASPANVVSSEVGTYAFEGGERHGAASDSSRVRAPDERRRLRTKGAGRDGLQDRELRAGRASFARCEGCVGVNCQTLNASTPLS